MLSKYLIGNSFGTIKPEDIIGLTYSLLLDDECMLIVKVKGEPWRSPNSGEPASDPS
jgi:hypothetical protein